LKAEIREKQSRNLVRMALSLGLAVGGRGREK
jgi:hypothetical protein